MKTIPVHPVEIDSRLRPVANRAADFGIPAHDIVVDPLVMPVGAMGSAGQQVFALVRRLRDELGVNTTCGASNISFGLPHRHGINAAFLPMAIGAGMTSAIMNPVRQVEMEAIRAANFLMNHDANGGEWIRFAKVLEAVEGGMTFAEASAAASQAAGGRRARSGGAPLRRRARAQVGARVHAADHLRRYPDQAAAVEGAVFGAIVALMGCYFGMNSARGAQGVGAATKKAVVTASIMILAANYALTEMFFTS